MENLEAGNENDSVTVLAKDLFVNLKFQKVFLIKTVTDLSVSYFIKTRFFIKESLFWGVEVTVFSFILLK